MTVPIIKILCVDDHKFIGEGLKTRLSIEDDMEFVGWLRSAASLATEVKGRQAHVVLLDIEMPGPDPFDATAQLNRQLPEVRVLMFSAHVRDGLVQSALNAGAWGYLSKGDDPDSVVDAIRKIVAGEYAFGSEVLAQCLHSKGRDGRSGLTPKLDLLTPREKQILRQIGKGMSRSDIAEEIHRSPKTVDNHCTAIMEKLDIHDRVELARYAIREGLIEP